MNVAGIAANYSSYEMGFKPSNIDQLKTNVTALTNFAEAAANKTADALGLASEDVVVRKASFSTEGTSRRRQVLAGLYDATASVQSTFAGLGMLWFNHVAKGVQLGGDAFQVICRVAQTLSNTHAAPAR